MKGIPPKLVRSELKWFVLGKITSADWLILFLVRSEMVRSFTVYKEIKFVNQFIKRFRSKEIREKEKKC